MHREQQARANEDAVEQERAGAAYAVLAAHVRSGEAQIFAHEIRQILARADTPDLMPPIDRHPNGAEEAGVVAFPFKFASRSILCLYWPQAALLGRRLKSPQSFPKPVNSDHKMQDARVERFCLMALYFFILSRECRLSGA